MKKILHILTILCLLICVNSYGKKNLKVTFIITSLEGKPESEASIYIKTDDRRENWFNGTYKSHHIVLINDKKNETEITFKLPAARFADRSVTIKVDGSSFYDHYILENTTIKDGQVFNIQLKRDWEAYHERTTEISLSAAFIYTTKSKDNEIVGAMKRIVSDQKHLDIEVLADDLERTENGYIEVVYSIDSNCTLINRKVVKKIPGMKTDLGAKLMDVLQKELKKSDTTCTPMDSLSMRFRWIVN